MNRSRPPHDRKIRLISCLIALLGIATVVYSARPAVFGTGSADKPLLASGIVTVITAVVLSRVRSY